MQFAADFPKNINQVDHQTVDFSFLSLQIKSTTKRAVSFLNVSSIGKMGIRLVRLERVVLKIA